eukprot:2488588-Amphidinium_carterae.2
MVQDVVRDMPPDCTEETIRGMPLDLDLHQRGERVQDPRSNGLERALRGRHPCDPMVGQLPGHLIPAWGVHLRKAINPSQAQHTLGESTPVDPLQEVLP